MKKKISLFMAAAMCLTIGGVYATWSYAQGAVPAYETKVSAELTGTTTESKKGTINVDESGVSILIDDTTADYIAELVIANPLKVSFTPAGSADVDVQENGIKLQMTIEETFGSFDLDGDDQTTNDVIDIFTIGNETGASSGTFVLNGGAAVKDPISIELKNYIKLNAGLTLPTKADYDRLDAIFDDTANRHFTITISEYIEPAQS